MGNPLPPPTVLTALAIGPNLGDSVRVIPPSDSPIAGTTYTLVLDDDGLWKRTTNSSAVTVTVPPHSAVPIPVNSSILISQGGAGAVTVAAGAGVTLNSSGGTLATTSEFEVIRLFQNTLDNWTLTITGTGGGGGGGSLSITDGTHTVAGTTGLTVTGATVGGTSPNATLLVEGVPTGGTTNQVLAKASNTNFDTAWVDAGGGFAGYATATDTVVGEGTPSQEMDVFHNTILGANAGAANTTGQYNTLIGWNAGTNLSGTNYGNVAVGASALENLTSSFWNVAIGDWAGSTMTDAGSCVAIGAEALGHTGGPANHTDGTIGIGYSAGWNVVGGHNSVIIGFSSAQNLTTGSSNVLIGDSVAPALITGSNNVIIGNGADASADNDDQTNINKVLVVDNNGNTFLNGPNGNPLPTSDPGVSGALWNNAGVLSISP